RRERAIMTKHQRSDLAPIAPQSGSQEAEFHGGHPRFGAEGKLRSHFPRLVLSSWRWLTPARLGRLQTRNDMRQDRLISRSSRMQIVGNESGPGNRLRLRIGIWPKGNGNRSNRKINGDFAVKWGPEDV